MSNRTTKPPENQDLRRMMNSLPMVVGNLLNCGVEIIGINTELQIRRDTQIHVAGNLSKLTEWAKAKDLAPEFEYADLKNGGHYWKLFYVWRHIKVFQVLDDEEKEAFENEAV